MTVSVQTSVPVHQPQTTKQTARSLNSRSISFILLRWTRRIIGAVREREYNEGPSRLHFMCVCSVQHVACQSLFVLHNRGHLAEHSLQGLGEENEDGWSLT